MKKPYAREDFSSDTDQWFEEISDLNGSDVDMVAFAQDIKSGKVKPTESGLKRFCDRFFEVGYHSLDEQIRKILAREYSGEFRNLYGDHSVVSEFFSLFQQAVMYNADLSGEFVYDYRQRSKQHGLKKGDKTFIDTGRGEMWVEYAGEEHGELLVYFYPEGSGKGGRMPVSALKRIDQSLYEAVQQWLSGTPRPRGRQRNSCREKGEYVKIFLRGDETVIEVMDESHVYVYPVGSAKKGSPWAVGQLDRMSPGLAADVDAWICEDKDIYEGDYKVRAKQRPYPENFINAGIYLSFADEDLITQNAEEDGYSPEDIDWDAIMEAQSAAEFAFEDFVKSHAISARNEGHDGNGSFLVNADFEYARDLAEFIRKTGSVLDSNFRPGQAVIDLYEIFIPEIDKAVSKFGKLAADSVFYDLRVEVFADVNDEDAEILEDLI